jgi:alpha-tubulin suppressor-like RCC1 family protein
LFPPVALGAFFTCAVATDASLRCWGKNTFGQLGYGDTVDRGDSGGVLSVGPVPVAGPVRQVVAGRHHTCAVLTNGAVQCWGSGVTSPETVNVGGPVQSLAAGALHTCAVLETGVYGLSRYTLSPF